MKLHACKKCGTVIVFKMQYQQSGCVVEEINRTGRICTCPVCGTLVREDRDAVSMDQD